MSALDTFLAQPELKDLAMTDKERDALKALFVQFATTYRSAIDHAIQLVDMWATVAGLNTRADYRILIKALEDAKGDLE